MFALTPLISRHSALALACALVLSLLAIVFLFLADRLFARFARAFGSQASKAIGDHAAGQERQARTLRAQAEADARTVAAGGAAGAP